MPSIRQMRHLDLLAHIAKNMQADELRLSGMSRDGLIAFIEAGQDMPDA